MSIFASEKVQPPGLARWTQQDTSLLWLLLPTSTVTTPSPTPHASVPSAWRVPLHLRYLSKGTSGLRLLEACPDMLPGTGAPSVHPSL